MCTEMIGKRIALLRKKKGVKQEELAAYTGVSAQAVSKWENGGVPDIGLLPKIADFFSVSVDTLFGRALSDCTEFRTAVIKKISGAPDRRKAETAFNICWDIERALMPQIEYVDSGSLDDIIKELGDNGRIYSSVISDIGFTRMGITDISQYFLLVPDPKNTDIAYFDGIDYPAFFKDMSDKTFFDAIVFLNSRSSDKAFTSSLLIRELGVETDRAEEILNLLGKYRMIYSSQLELDDEIQTVYYFNPTPSFVALLIFARELIDTPENFAYHSSKRKQPYFTRQKAR